MVVRTTLADVPPATLVAARLAVALAVLAPFPRRGARAPAPGDRARIAWMGVLGFTAAYALGNWGVALSSATHAALLIGVEPAAVILLAPALLGERLGRRGLAGAALVTLGATLITLGGVPGLDAVLAPTWRGDLLLLLSALAFAAYTLLARPVLARVGPMDLTRRSMAWGLAATAPLAALEWATGHRATWSPSALAGTVYLGVVVTALGYLVWNWALERVPAPRAAVFLNVQPVVGALLGVVLLGEPLGWVAAFGGLAVLAGLWLTARDRPPAPRTARRGRRSAA